MSERLTGDEPFAGLDASVRDFCSFVLSDMHGNIHRGCLAEILVARVNEYFPSRVHPGRLRVLRE